MFNQGNLEAAYVILFPGELKRQYTKKEKLYSSRVTFVNKKPQNTSFTASKMKVRVVSLVELT